MGVARKGGRRRIRGARSRNFSDWPLDAKASPATKMPIRAKADLVRRIEFSRRTLGLSDETQTLCDHFYAENIVESWLNSDENRSIRRKRSNDAKTVDSISSDCRLVSTANFICVNAYSAAEQCCCLLQDDSKR